MTCGPRGSAPEECADVTVHKQGQKLSGFPGREAPVRGWDQHVHLPLKQPLVPEITPKTSTRWARGRKSPEQPWVEACCRKGQKQRGGSRGAVRVFQTQGPGLPGSCATNKHGLKQGSAYGAWPEGLAAANP